MQVMTGDVRNDGAGFQFGHVEKVGNEAIQPLGFVNDRCQQVGLLFVVQLAGQIAQGSGSAKHRRERRFKVVGYRGRAGPNAGAPSRWCV